MNSWQGFDKKKINEFDKFLIPVNSGSGHWVLLVYNTKDNILQCYDSYHKNAYKRPIKNVVTFIESQGIEKPKIKYVKDIPLQTDLNSCGVYVLENARCIILKNGKIDYTEKDIPAARLRIKNELNTNHLSSL